MCHPCSPMHTTQEDGGSNVQDMSIRGFVEEYGERLKAIAVTKQKWSTIGGLMFLGRKIAGDYHFLLEAEE